MRDAVVARLLQRAAVLRRGGVRTPYPHRIDERQAGHRLPFGAEIDFVDGARPGIDVERRIADYECGIRAVQHRVEVRLRRRKRWRNPPVLRTQHAGQGHRRLRTQVERNRFYLCDRFSSEYGNGCDFSIRGNRHVRDDAVVGVEIFDCRDEPEIDLAAMQQRRAFRRHVEPHVESIGLDLEPVDQRLRIQIRDRAKAQRPALSERRGVAPLRVEGGHRSAAVKPAAAMLRRTSSTDVRRRPSDSSSTVDTRSRSLAPKVSATWASLGPYCVQSTWMFFTAGSASRASAIARTSSYPVVGTAIDCSRGSGATALIHGHCETISRTLRR